MSKSTGLLTLFLGVLAVLSAQVFAATPMPGSDSGPKAFVFIDSRIPEAERLRAAMLPEASVVLIEAGDDGLTRIADALGDAHDVAAIHVLSHGQAGRLELGGQSLALDAFKQAPRAIAAIRRALRQDADLLLYGCNVAQGPEGQAFVSGLAQLTGADVAASSNVTGAKRFGGDWQLEVSEGVVTAALPVPPDVLAEFDGVLVTNGTANGTYDFGSLGATDSGGVGFKTQGDKFKVSNAFTSGGTAIYLNATQSTPGVILKAEGGTTMKTFSFSQMNFGNFAGSATITDFSLIVKDYFGNTIATHSFSGGSFVVTTADAPITAFPFTVAFPASGYDNVAQIEFSYALTASTSNFELRSITLANISNAAPVTNNAPTAGTVTANNVTQASAGASSYTFTIAYSDADANFDSSTIGTGDVTVSGGATVSNASYSGTASSGTATYTVTPPGGTWDDGDNGNYTIAIVGNQVGDTAPAYVAANASAGSFTVSMDTTAPTVNSVSVPANATYVAGQNLDFTVNTSENVTVNTGGGTPTLALTIGATGKTASYVSGSGTTALLFRYTVEVGLSDADGIALGGSIAANGGALKDAAGNDLATTLNSVGSLVAVLVDSVPPKTYVGALPTGGTATATVTGGGATCGFTKSVFINVSGDVGSPSVPPPSTHTFQHGLFDFILSSCTPGSTVTVSITYATNLPNGTVYWKFGPTRDPSWDPVRDPTPGVTPHWYQVASSLAGKTISFSITDGQLGDDDLAADGVIVDQGGPAAPVALAAAATAIPTLSEWGVMLLSLMVGGLAALGLRRERP